MCAALLAACERQPERSVPVQPTTVAPAPRSGDGGTGGVRLALLEPSRVMDMAALEGFLHVEGPCLYIVGIDNRRSRTLPAFHIADIRWDAGTEMLRVGSKAYSNGQRVLLGGGHPTTGEGLKWVQRPDPSCDASDLFVAGSIEAATAQ